jgi:hypothetical protein
VQWKTSSNSSNFQRIRFIPLWSARNCTLGQKRGEIYSLAAGLTVPESEVQLWRLDLQPLAGNEGRWFAAKQRRRSFASAEPV